MKPRLVVIEWVDSSTEDAWTFTAPKDEPLKCYSSGWLILDGNHVKVVAGSIADDGEQHCGAMTIPTCAILSMRYLDES